MSESRNRILARLRAGSGGPPTAAPQPWRPRFGWTHDERIALFTERMEAVRAEVHRVGDDWPARLAGIAIAKGVRNLLLGRGAVADALRAAWGEAPPLELRGFDTPVESHKQALFGATDAALTGARAAIAETGSLVLWAGAEEPRTLSLVPHIHFVLLDAATLCDSFAELIEREQWGRGMPTNALLISGPSKTADIEQVLAYGVHGPKALVVLLRG